MDAFQIDDIALRKVLVQFCHMHLLSSEAPVKMHARPAPEVMRFVVGALKIRPNAGEEFSKAEQKRLKRTIYPLYRRTWLDLGGSPEERPGPDHRRRRRHGKYKLMWPNQRKQSGHVEMTDRDATIRSLRRRITLTERKIMESEKDRSTNIKLLKRLKVDLAKMVGSSSSQPEKKPLSVQLPRQNYGEDT
ncbi:MAG TPA: hypothetical protein VMW12_02560 [Candidatus Dormibacteraeota bacterium]|nr:hypothetical protein [Candidatus Dormibacteraeota bacterium]